MDSVEIVQERQDWIALSAHLSGCQESLDFDHFADFIQDSRTLTLATRFLESIQLWAEKKEKNLQLVHPRVLLAGFLMAKFPKELLDESEPDMKDEMDKTVLQLAREMVFTVLEPSNQLVKVKSCVQLFAEGFGSWKRYDQDRQIRRMERALLEWRMTHEFLSRSLPFTSAPEGTRDIIGQIDRLIEKTELRLRQVGGKAAVENARKKEVMVVDIDQLIQRSASEEYWKVFGEEIERNEFHRVVLLLSEICRRLQLLTPSNQAEKKRVETNIDVDFVGQMIASGVFDGPQFVRVFGKVWDCIRSLQAPSQDEEWDVWKVEIMHSLSQSPAWSELLPRVFNRFLVQLDRIEELADFYRSQLEE